MQIWEPHALGETTVVRAGEVEVAIAGTEAITVTPVAPDVWLIDAPEGTAAQWRLPCVDAAAFWTPGSGTRWIPPIWSSPAAAGLVSGAPVVSLVGTAGANLCTVALASVTGSFTGGVIEETGEFVFTVQNEGLRIRLDLSDRQFSAALTEVAGWWQEGRDLPPTPRQARLPVYSTWYSMHQEVSRESVELQASLAKELGCATMIVDDGWQTADRSRGYAFCGDWEPNISDIRQHIQRVQSDGMAYLLWYALPFVGKHNAAFERFEGKFLRYLDHMDAAVLDPRHPEVRAFLVDKLARAVEEWGADGLKIDFVDRFGTDEGVAELLSELDVRLRAAKPDVLIEHRQPYTSPGLWPYANMVRAVDCPLSPQENRQRTIDLRLTAGPQAVHSDMILWHPDESAEQVAVHLINVLFSVPQISVDLAAQRPDQLAAIRFWLGVFRRHLATLQLGVLEPHGVEHGYPLVRAYSEETEVVARYAALPVDVPEIAELLVANAAPDTRVVLYGRGVAAAEVRDCGGRLVSESELRFTSGASVVEVPVGGLLTVRRD
ncbi:glycoside hydrolase family 36 protein [Nonomuraea sp. NPDC003560]|uniref:glycoside hydrolase family 36 protein n=1 Tax=Nonomuraea sp. NPDC003560 TaxID=3364341 RepID=UPI0036CD1310